MDSVQWECWDIYSRCAEEHPWDFAWKSLWKTPVWRIMWQTKGRKQARYVCAVAQLVFHVEKGSKVFVPIPETGDPYIFLD